MINQSFAQYHTAKAIAKNVPMKIVLNPLIKLIALLLAWNIGDAPIFLPTVSKTE